MGSLSNFGETALVKHLTKETAYSPAATIYLALATSDPGEAATGASMNEVANSGSYARAAIAFGAASSRRVTQSGAVTFPAATGSWGTVTHWAIVDSATYGAGNVLAYGALTNSKTIVSGNTPSIATTIVYVELTASTGLSNYFANGFLDRMFRNQAFTIAANYLAFTTSAPTDSSTGSTIVEPSGNNYSRVQINASGGASPAWNAVSGGATDNANTITSPTASGSWGTIVYMAVVDASSTGNMLFYADIADQAVGTDDYLFFAAGDLDVSQS